MNSITTVSQSFRVGHGVQQAGASKLPAMVGFSAVLCAYAVAFVCVLVIGMSMVKLIRLSTTLQASPDGGSSISYADDQALSRR